MMKYIKKVLLKIVENLVKKEYSQAINEGFIQRFDPQDVKSEIESYPGVLTLPPDSAFDHLLIIPKEGSDEKLVLFNLWFDNHEEDLQIIILINERELKYAFWDILVP